MTDPTTQERLAMLAARRSASAPNGGSAKPPLGNTRRGHPAIGSRIAVAGFGATATLGMVAGFTLTSNTAPSTSTVAAASAIEQASPPTTTSTAVAPTTSMVAQEPIKLTLPPTTAPAPVVTQAPRSESLAIAAAPTAPPATATPATAPPVPAPTAPPTQSSGS